MVSSPQPGAPRRAGARLVALPSPTLDQADDGTLARAASGGDPRAAGVLWDRFSPLARRMLRRTLGPRANVEPLLQKVFVRVLQRVGMLPESAQLRPLVVAITARLLTSELRRQRMLGLLRLHRPWRASEDTVVTDAATRGALESLYRILDELDADARVAFALRHFEGLSATELACAMDTSVPSVKRSLARANSLVEAALGRDESLKAYVMAGNEGASA